MACYIVKNQPHGVGNVYPITFTLEDAICLHYPHCNALVVTAAIVRNGLKHMLVDIGTQLTSQLMPSMTKYLLLDLELIPITFPLYGFTCDTHPKKNITLVVEQGHLPNDSPLCGVLPSAQQVSLRQSLAQKTPRQSGFQWPYL